MVEGDAGILDVALAASPFISAKAGKHLLLRMGGKSVRIGSDLSGELAATLRRLDSLGLKQEAEERILALARQSDEFVLDRATLQKIEQELLDGARRTAPDSGLVARIQAKLGLYPKVVDPRTGRNILFPSGIRQRISKADRVTWTSQDRYNFIKEWYDRGYPMPRGGWDNYVIHHIQPREFGGTNDFWNLVPVERNTHKLFNDFWREFLEL